MDLSQKPLVSRPRVIHGPHRIRLSGVIRTQPIPREEVLPGSTAAESELVGETVDIPMETFSPEEPK